MNDKTLRARFSVASCRSRRPHGFTLVELLLVLVILSVLAVVIVPKFSGRSQQAKVTGAQADIAALETALGLFEVDCGRFPTTEEGLQALIRQPGDLDGWKGPYLTRGNLPKDHWGNHYVYRCPGQHNNSYDLCSFGPDGQEGGGDDIDNWSER